jgi:hypothetical protein
MPSFVPLNTSNSYLVEELNIYNINKKKIKDTFKDVFSFINPLGLLPKE